ncbi:MAG: MFS transporter, partial [bacterium]
MSNTSAYRWVILAFAILAYGTSQFARQNYGGIQKFIADDLQLDRGAIGLLGAAFFYSYALFQMPWGIASDRFGSRAVIGLGILLTALTMVGFATGESSGSLIAWRIASGVAAAAVYIPLTGSIARWFSERERSFSQGTLGGVGGALGEGMAYVLLPVLAIYFASGWRQGTNIVAGVIAVMGVLCLFFLKSAPSGEAATTRHPFDRALLRDAQLWCYAFLYSGFVVGIRGTQTWLAVYAADVYIAERGMSLNQAVVGGGLLALLAYSVAGRAIGCPIAGKISDLLARRG